MINAILRDELHELDDLARYNGKKTIQHKESVSQHSYWVTFYSNLIFRALFHKPIMTCTDVISQRHLVTNYHFMHSFLMWVSLYHDFDENITGDVLWKVKYDDEYGDIIKKALNQIKLKVVETYPRDVLYYDFTSSFKTDLFPEVNIDNLSKEQKTICLNIIKMADWLSVLRFSNIEIELGNKRRFEPTIGRAFNGIESCITQLELLTFGPIQPMVDVSLFLTLRSELIELKTKLQIL